jgi:DNA-binding CsgD family transcriptional regulator
MQSRSRVLKETATIVTNRVAVLEARGVETRSLREQRLAADAPLPADHWPNPLPAPTRVDAAQGGTAFLLTDLNWKPIYTNDAAVLILHYPDEARFNTNPAAVQERIRSIFHAERFTTGSPPTSFLSGRRHYVCRPFFLESQNRSPIVALLLERCHQGPVEFSEVSRRFHLSRRESETVQHLSHGLTTKEVAQRMSISPNTVKQFVRLIMSKMSVTTRSGIIGKLLSG